MGMFWPQIEEVRERERDVDSGDVIYAGESDMKQTIEWMNLALSLVRVYRLYSL